jgi:hypothetical protein
MIANDFIREGCEEDKGKGNWKRFTRLGFALHFTSSLISVSSVAVQLP